MEDNKENKEVKKLSYEQLEQIANQYSEQARQLYLKLQEANMANMFKRMDYLFKVVENNKVFSSDFVEKCISEIEELMKLPEETKEEE